MAVLKSIISLYGAGEEKSIERYKTRIKIGEEHRSISAFKRNLIDFLGLNNQAKKFALGSFDLKLYRLVKFSGKTGKREITLYQPNSSSIWNYPYCLTQMVKAS